MGRNYTKTTRKKAPAQLKKERETAEAQKIPFDKLVILIEKQKIQIENHDANWNQKWKESQLVRNELDKKLQTLRRLLKLKKESMQKGVRRG